MGAVTAESVNNLFRLTGSLNAEELYKMSKKSRIKSFDPEIVDIIDIIVRLNLIRYRLLLLISESTTQISPLMQMLCSLISSGAYASPKFRQA